MAGEALRAGKINQSDLNLPRPFYRDGFYKTYTFEGDRRPIDSIYSMPR
jgi:hypothetical protein